MLMDTTQPGPTADFVLEPEVTSMAINLLGLTGNVKTMRENFQNPTYEGNRLIKALVFAKTIHRDNEFYSSVLAKLFCITMTDTWSFFEMLQLIKKQPIHVGCFIGPVLC